MLSASVDIDALAVSYLVSYLGPRKLRELRKQLGELAERLLHQS